MHHIGRVVESRAVAGVGIESTRRSWRVVHLYGLTLYESSMYCVPKNYLLAVQNVNKPLDALNVLKLCPWRQSPSPSDLVLRHLIRANKRQQDTLRGIKKY